LNKGRTLAGIITADDAAEMVKRGEKDLSQIICTDIKTVLPDTPAQDLFGIIHNLGYPLAVVDETNHLKGVIVRGTLIAALADRGGNE